MFMLTMGAGTDLAFPDVCTTPVPSPTGVTPTPLPYPNTAMSAATDPTAETVLIDCMPTLNLTSEGKVSVGDNAGAQGGVTNAMISGGTVYLVGCFTIMVEGVPAQRLTSVTGQNAQGVMPNAPGMCIVPSQVTVLSLG